MISHAVTKASSKSQNTNHLPSIQLHHPRRHYIIQQYTLIKSSQPPVTLSSYGSFIQRKRHSDAPLLEAPNCIASSTTSRRVNFTSKRSNRFNNSVWLRPLQRSFPFYPGRSVQEITANYCIQKWINPCQSCTETSLHPQNLPSCPHNF